MLITSIQRIRTDSKRYKISFEGADPIVLYRGELKSLALKEGQEIDCSEYNRICTEILTPRAKKRALHLLEKQDRTRSNLISKLMEGGYSQEICEEAVCYVEGYGYIGDRRYAANYVHFNQAKKSKRRITADLRKKGISDDLIDQALYEEYTSSERDQIEALLQKKHYNPDVADQKEKAKIYRFLMGKGFDYDDIKNYL